MIQSKQILNFTFPSDREITISRIFDAPRELVFKVYTDPSFIVQWWGQKNLKTMVEDIELKSGGKWKFVQSGNDNIKHVFKGFYSEVKYPEKLVYTFESEAGSGHIVQETVTFKEQDGKTILTDTSTFNTVDDRNRMLLAGFESGVEATMDRFAGVIEKYQNKHQ